MGQMLVRGKPSKGQGREICGHAAGCALPPRGPRSLLDAQTAAAKPQGKKKNPFHSMELAKHAPGGVQETSSCPGDLLEDAQKTSACPGAPLGGCRVFGGRQRAAAGSWGRRHPRDGGSAPRLGAGCSSAHRASSQLREDESTCPTNDQKASCLRVL